MKRAADRIVNIKNKVFWEEISEKEHEEVETEIRLTKGTAYSTLPSPGKLYGCRYGAVTELHANWYAEDRHHYLWVC